MADKWTPAVFGSVHCKVGEGAFGLNWRRFGSILLLESVGDRMKRFCCWVLVLCMACSFSTAMAQDTWTCTNCGSEAFGNFCSNCGSARPAETWTCTGCGMENQGNFCSNCGAAKSDGETWQCPVCGESVTGGFCTNCAANGLNGDRLTYYYIRSVSQDLDIPYLTNLMRWRDGDEETSSLAVFVRDPESGDVVMFSDASIVSDGCDYTWQCRKDRYYVTLYPSSVPEEGPKIISFTPSDEDTMAEILESMSIPDAATPQDQEELTLCYYVLDESEEVLREESCLVTVDGYQDWDSYQQILFSFQGENEGLIASGADDLYHGIRGVLVNEDDCLCGVLIDGYGAISFLPLDDETFYAGAEESEEEADFEQYAELAYAFSATAPEGLDWDNIAGWNEQDRALMSLYMIYSLISEESYSAEPAFDWENMYSGTMRFESGHEEFILFAADGNDVLFLEWFTGSPYGDAIYCYRLINADPSDMHAAIEGFKQSPPGAGVTLSLTKNNYALMEEYAATLFGGEDDGSETDSVPMTMHEYSEKVLGTYIGYDSIGVNDAGQIHYTYRKYSDNEDVEGARALCDSYADYLEHECGFTLVHEGNKGEYHYEYVLRKTAGDAQYEITLDFWRSSGFMGGWITASYNDAFAALYPELTGNQATSSASDGKEKCGYCFGSGKCTNCGGTGRVRKLLAGTTEWVEQDCTSCRPTGSGNCSFCGGTGYR